MLFNSTSFAIAFAALLGVYRLLPSAHRRGLLLGASLVFYAMWIPPYLLLLLAELGVGYALLRWMQRSRRPRRVLAASVVLSLAVLGWYKYAAFLVVSVDPLLAWLGLPEPRVPEILLPLGISFFTFQLIALHVDTYRGRVDPVRSFREYALFIAFFPQLVAGPILRGAQFLPQLRAGGRVEASRTRRGAWLLAVGLAKKMLVADLLLAPYVDRVFGDAGHVSGIEHLVAIYSFAFQIYFDFSGYTDMARGLAALLGFDLPANFHEPFLSRSPSELWRRWHITLSTWLRDYLYIPLGGNRRGRARTYVNLALTMLLGGLWHGAGWTFVVWGGLHGLYLVVHRAFFGTTTREDAPLRLRDAPAVLLVFHLTAGAFVFFRAADLGDAWAVLHATATGAYLGSWPVLQIAVVGGCAVLHLLERIARVHADAWLQRLGGWPGAVLEGALLGGLGVALALLGGSGGEFIYFQF